MSVRFCELCSGEMVPRAMERKFRPVCAQCGYVRYGQLIVGAGGIIQVDGRLLLIRRIKQPFLGCWSLPAGHVDEDEPPASAAAREVFEETGLEVTVRRLVDAYFFDDHPKGCGVFLVYDCDIAGGQLRETDEGASPTFFERDTLPAQLAGGGHSIAIHAWRLTATGADGAFAKS